MTAHRTLLPASSLAASCLAIAASLASMPAMAEIVATDAADAENPIIVIGRAEGYVASQTVTATKTDTPLIDVPQSIQVVTREKLDDQASYSLADVLRYVPGTTIGQGEGNRDQITLRGQNTTADFFLDGVRDDVQYYRGLYNIERVEVLKGPYALIFGRGGGGGIINRVQKTPDAARLFVAGRASINSFGAYDLSADVNMPVSDTTALRVNGTYENFDNHREYYGGERYAVNPYLATRLGERWTLGLSYEYVHDDRVTDRGVPSVATAPGQPNAPLRGHDSTFFGVPGVNRTKLEAHIVKARLDGELTDNLKLTSTILYGDYDKIYNNAYANGALNTATNEVALGAYSDPTTRENFIAQGNLIWDVATGPLDHKILFGLEYGSQKTANQRYNTSFSPSNLFDLDTMVYPSVTFTTPSRNTHSDVSFFSAYTQDQISLGAHFDLVLGLRYDHFKIKGIDIQDSNRAFGRTDNKVSPRFGLIYKPQENISIYGSFSQSFLPRAGDQFTTMTASQQNLAPEKFTNYELGAKWDIRSNLNATAAVFQLDRTNATTPDPANVLATINIGETRTQGVELALTGNILRNWQMSAGYTYQNGKLRGNSAVRLAQLPRHQVALWNRYDFNDTVGLGLGMVHQSSQYAAIRTSSTTTRLPAFTRFDAALFIKASRQIDLQVNIENLLDTHYFADAHNNNNITPGAPLNARFTARVKF